MIRRPQYRSSSYQRPRKWWRLQLFLLVLCTSLVVAWLYLPIDARLVERYYSQALYPAIGNVLIPLNSLLPVPLTLIALFVVVVVAIYNLVRAITRGGFWRWLLGCLLMLSVISLWFIVAWGANYKRMTVSELLELDTVQISNQADGNQADGLEQLATYLIEVIEQTAHVRNSSDPTATKEAIQANARALENFLPNANINAPKLPQSVKYWPEGSLLTAFSASGVMLPWFVEATVDSGLAEADLVAISAHELAHAAGIATEGDADFIGILAGLSATNAFSRYAAALRSYQKISGDLPETLKTRLDARLPAIAKADWNDTYNAYLKYQAPQWLKQQNQSIYNSYLQSQGVEEGIQDYGRSTQLLIKAMQKGLLPEQ